MGESSHEYSSVPVIMTPGDDTCQLVNGHLILCDIPEESAEEEDANTPEVCDRHPGNNPAGEETCHHVEVEIRTNNSRGRHSQIVASPSDSDLLAMMKQKKLLSLPQTEPKTRSLGYIESQLTDVEKLEAFRNMHRRSTQPEVFIFPESAKSHQPGQLNVGYNSDHSDSNKKSAPCDHQVDIPVSADEVFVGTDLEGARPNGELVKIDYDSLFAAKKMASAAVDSVELPKVERSMSLSEKAYQKVVRKFSGRKQRGRRVERLQLDGPVPAPSTFFDLALFSCCCCLSPLGFIAVLLSVSSGVAYKEGNMRKAQRYSHLTLILSILGIGLTLLMTILILVTRFYYWDDDYEDQHFPPAN